MACLRPHGWQTAEVGVQAGEHALEPTLLTIVLWGLPLQPKFMPRGLRSREMPPRPPCLLYQRALTALV